MSGSQPNGAPPLPVWQEPSLSRFEDVLHLVANGRATIFVIASGRQGQQVVRVVPNYQGRWIGGLRVTSCSETGVFAEFDFCDDFAVGDVNGYSLNLSQTGEQ